MATPELQPLEQLKPEVSPIVEPARGPQSGLAKLMGQAKQFSELGIAIPALLYTCGFVVLGCYGEENSLGLQVFPAIQFFSAGAGFLIIFASAVLLIVAVRQLLNKSFNWLNSGTKTSKLVRKVIPWVLGGSFAVFYLAGMFHLERIRVTALYAITITLFFSAETGPRNWPGIICTSSPLCWAFSHSRCMHSAYIRLFPHLSAAGNRGTLISRSI